MVRLSDSTHKNLTALGKYEDTIDDIVNRLIRYYSFNDVLEILNEGDRKLIPTRFMQTLCGLDQEAIQKGRPNEFMPDELWTELGGFNMERVYPIVEHYFMNHHHYMVRHPDGKISLTNVGRKCCDQQFVLPQVIRPSSML
jgi:hypothetical protein